MVDSRYRATEHVAECSCDFDVEAPTTLVTLRSVR